MIGLPSISDKIGLYAAGALCVILAVTTVTQCSGRQAAEKRAVVAQEALLDAKADLGTCRGNVGSLEASVASQNAEISRLASESEAKLAESRKLASEAVKGQRSAEGRARKLRDKTLTGLDQCSRMLEADQALTEALK